MKNFKRNSSILLRRIFCGWLLVLIWCFCGTFSYTVHRSVIGIPVSNNQEETLIMTAIFVLIDLLHYEDDKGTSSDLEIDFYSSDEMKKIIENINRFNEQTQFAMNFHNYEPIEPESKPSESQDNSSLDSWSVIWYVASFGGLIAFFLIVSCSEWCCRRAVRNNCSSTTNNSTNISQRISSSVVTDTPPPSYDHFAPPSYESICLGRSVNEKSEYDIYVVPVHALGTIIEAQSREHPVVDQPPSYLSANTFSPTYPPIISNNVDPSDRPVT